jgi:rhodanese-related sulfurtransferase
MRRQYPIMFVLMALLVSAGCSGGSTPAGNAAAGPGSISEISAQAALPKVEGAYSQFIDVRTADEYASGHATRAINIPLDELPNRYDRLEKNEPVYIICETGRRSKEAADILSAKGFKEVISVTGGTAAWREAGLPIETVIRK